MFCVHCLLKRMLGVVFWTCISVGDSFIGYSIFSWLFYYLLTAVYWNLQLQLRICQFLLLCLPTFDTKYFGVLSRFSRVPLCVTPWTVACQVPLSMGFFRQEYWNGLPLPSPGELPDPEIEPRSPSLQADALPTELWKQQQLWHDELR